MLISMNGDVREENASLETRGAPFLNLASSSVKCVEVWKDGSAVKNSQSSSRQAQ